MNKQGLTAHAIRPKLKASQIDSKGFTLIEILVVMMIMGIILSFVVVAFGDFGASRRTSMTTEHFASLLKLARFKAIIGADTYGVNIKPTGYTFYRFQSDPNSPYGKWKEIVNDHIFKPENFPPHTTLTTTLPTHTQQPDVVITPGGQITEFTLTLSNGDDKYQIVVKNNGEIRTVLHE